MKFSLLLSLIGRNLSAPSTLVTVAAIGLAAGWLTSGCSSTSPKTAPQSQSSVAPTRFNVDFGPWKPGRSAKTGPAAAGKPGDFWNVVGIPWNNNHTESGLKAADGSSSQIRVQLINLGGGWSSQGKLGVPDPMLDTYNYPQNNQGGNSEVILFQVSPGSYQLYIYGHGGQAAQFGDYEVTVGSSNYGRKRTSASERAIHARSWSENTQYVRYPKLSVKEGDEIRILIRPGGAAFDMRHVPLNDAIINGLQLVPVR
jgi:hypothetical protein